MQRLSNWLLSKSTRFKSLLIDSDRHKKNTHKSFKKVKRDNLLIVKKLKQHETKIDNLHKYLKKMTEIEPLRIYKEEIIIIYTIS